MKIRNAILVLSIACLTGWSVSVTFCADEPSNREYQIKAAFLSNFIMFVDNERFGQLDEEATEGAPDPNEPLIIGILGKDPFGDAFRPLEDEGVRNRRVLIRRFKGFDDLADAEGRPPRQHPDLEQITQCHVLFICASEREHFAAILKPIAKHSLLTVADTPGFMEACGVINFVIEDKKVRFEINVAAARRAKLKIRSKLLRLAKRVITSDVFEGQNDEGN
jgi:hypothetical protein